MEFRIVPERWDEMSVNELMGIKSAFMDYMVMHEEIMTSEEADNNWANFNRLSDYIEERKK